MKSINFTTGSSSGYMSRFDEVVSKIDRMGTENLVRQTDLMHEAMNSVIGLTVLSGLDPLAVWIIEALPSFWCRAGQGLARHRIPLAGYQARMDTSLWRRTDEGWFSGNLRRTGLEIVRTDIEPASGPVLGIEALTELNETDEELREIASQVPPLPEDAIPAGIPAAHWWWTLPTGEASNTVSY